MHPERGPCDDVAECAPHQTGIRVAFCRRRRSGNLPSWDSYASQTALLQDQRHLLKLILSALIVTEAMLSKRRVHRIRRRRERAALATTLEAVNISSIVEPSIESLSGSLFSDSSACPFARSVDGLEILVVCNHVGPRVWSCAPLYTYYNPEETSLDRYQVPDIRLMRNWESYE